MRNMVVVKSCEKIRSNDCSKLQCLIDWVGEPKQLWINYPEHLDQFIDEKWLDWAAVAILVPVMQKGYSIKVEGSLSAILLQYLNSDIQFILNQQNPNFNKVDVTCAEAQVRLPSDQSFSGVGFSAGVDSMSSLALLNEEQAIHPNYLATFNAGALGKDPEVASKMLKKYTERLMEYCQKYNYLPLSIDSNISSFYNDVGFQSTHTLRSAAIVLGLGKTFRNYFYSSTFVYPQIAVKETYDISFADPILLPLLSNECTQLRAIGTPLSRLEKVRLVTKYQPSYDYLDVCVHNAEQRIEMKKPNCSKCWKCVRQLMTLDLLDCLDYYKKVFDVEYYLNHVEQLAYNHCMTALSPNRPNDTDVLKLAQEKGIITSIDLEKLITLASISWKLKTILANLVAKQFSRNRREHYKQWNRERLQ